MLPLLTTPFDYLSAAYLTLSHKSLRRWFVIPYLIGLVSFALFVTSGFEWREDLAKLFLPARFENYANWLGWLVFLLGIIVSTLASLLVTLIFGAVFIENFVQAALVQVGMTPIESSGVWGFVRAIVRSLKESVVRLICALILGTLFFVLGFFPLLWVIPIVAGAFLLGFDIVDQPLTLLGYKLTERWRIARAHKMEVFALGLVFSLSLFVPFGSILLLPFAYVAATKKIARWQLQAVERSSL